MDVRGTNSALIIAWKVIGGGPVYSQECGEKCCKPGEITEDGKVKVSRDRPQPKGREASKGDLGMTNSIRGP